MTFLGIMRTAILELEAQYPLNLGIRQIHHYARGTSSTQCGNKYSIITCSQTQYFPLVNKLDSTRNGIIGHPSKLCCDIRNYSTSQGSRKDIVERTGEKTFSELTLGEKVTQTGKDASYLAVIVVGVGVTGLMFYAIGREIFSSESPSGVYGKSLKICRKNVQVMDALGEPIKGYGEMSSRGRRRHVSHLIFNRGGVEHMQMKFYVEGPRQKGTVHLEMKKNDRGKYEYVYMIVELDTAYPRRNIVIEDNRQGAASLHV